VEQKVGIAVSPGVAIARAFPLESEEFVVTSRPVAAESVDEEIDRFHAAVAAAVEEVKELRAASGLSADLGQLFEAHIVLLQDKKIHAEVLEAIRAERLPAEYCVRQVCEHHANRLAQLEDEYFAERAKDVQDIEHRILRQLSGARQEELSGLTDPVIIVARDLTPSQTASLDKKKIKGIAIDIGGRTSHTAIVARSLGIPAVVGLRDLSQAVEAGVPLIVDGNRGRVVVAPDPDTEKAYLRVKKEYEAYRRSLKRSTHLVAETRDGIRIKLFGNIEHPRDAAAVRKHGGDGVGLFRTEFLFTDPANPPTEEQHFEAYRQTIRKLEGKPLVIRTLDVGGDKISADPTMEPERNPFMGLRSIRYCLARPEIFVPQLKAILRAADLGDVRIMFPMISAVEEVRKANAYLEDARDQLRSEKRAFRTDTPVGAMVETPSAALAADVLAREVDFFSIGTNDLIQYTMAVDRGNEKVASLYQPAHPSVLRLLSEVIRTSVDRGVEVAVCGEICSEPLFTMLLLGMGLRELSLAPNLIPEIKKVIRSVTVERAREVAATAIAMGEAEQTERFLHASLRQVLPMIF
jgi:phosphotransferase system enzyme I (PtsI)